MPLSNPITEPQIPPPIARDAEFQAADAAHVAAPNPHPQYQSILPVSIVEQRVNAPAQISLLANTWFSLGILNNLNSGNSESLFAMSLYIQYVISGVTQLYWQYSGACLISPVWWKAGGAQLVKYIDMEGHNSVDFIVSFRLGIDGQGNRMVEIYPQLSLSACLIRATFVRLF
ncbi:hypothetical protein [Microcoleus sp. S13_C5]|uniref:hypothetical protein n=1 Tax=Microcoleus sp. S13_C5 TaxID=3055411 RepID=UPI002FD65105